jgi:hypothetical protein
MAPLDWLGPAVIGALVTAFGWFATYHTDRRRQNDRRSERIRDCKIALRAEISCHLPRWNMPEADAHIEQMAKSIRDGVRKSPPFTPFVPKETPNPAFLAVANEIQILPGDVIEPVIRYYQQVDVISQLAEDMRTEVYAGLEPDRKIAVYRDFIELRLQAARFADDAIAALEHSSDDT